MAAAKLFISYAHENEPHKDTFCKFLATLKRNKDIEEWHDRRLIAGGKLNQEIISKLEDADAVCLLITQDFLNSYYCVEEELRRALQRAEQNQTKIFPVIVDHCMWLDTEIREFTCVPQDGNPVTEFENQNKGWMQVTEELKNLVNEIKKEKQQLNQRIVQEELFTMKNDLTKSFSDFLDGTEVNLQHSYKDQITLFDTFVYPDFKVTQDDIEEYEVAKNSSFFSDPANFSKLSLIIGEEQSGKTSIAKKIYSDVRAKSAFPLFVEGSNLGSSNIERVISKELSRQYQAIDYKSYLEGGYKRVLILDNANEVKLNAKALNNFLIEADGIFDRIIIISEESIQYNDEVFSIFEDYKLYEILPFGYERRDELLRTWYSIGRAEQIENSELIEIVDQVSNQLDAVIRKNIVPPKPLFILMIVQTLDSSQTQDYSLTSHGYCYQILIQENLKKAKIRADQIDKYINYLTHLAYFMYREDRASLDENLIKKFKSEYSKKFVLNSHDEIIKNLTKAKLVRASDSCIEIKYRYIFYFYVAKYMSDSEDALIYIDSLCDKLHMEKHSNILIFITHHTRSKRVIDKIIHRTVNVFPNENAAQLGKKDTGFLLEFIDEIPDLVIKHRNNVLEARKDRFVKKDKREAKFLTDESMELTQEEADSISESNRDIARSVRSVEIIGQIIKNRHASIEQSQLNELATQAIDVGLRFLNFYISSTKDIQSELIDIIHKYLENHSDLSDEKIAELSKQSFIQMIYGLSFNVIKKISSSIGHRELIGLFGEINKDTVTPAYSLINANIQLEFKSNKSSIPRKELEDIWKSLEGEFLAERLLKASVLQFLYLNFVGYKDKSWISSKLGIPLEVQDRYTGNKKSKLIGKN